MGLAPRSQGLGANAGAVLFCAFEAPRRDQAGVL